MKRSEAKRRINELRLELDDRPDVCPWCGSTRMFSKHAPRKHPDEYEEWKKDHEKIEVGGTIWVEGES